MKRSLIDYNFKYLLTFLCIILSSAVGINIKGQAQIISTYAGTGFGAPNAGGFTGDGGPATDAEFYGITGVAVDDSGNVYIADFYNNRVRKVNVLTGIVTSIAGSNAPFTSAYTGDGGPATAAGLFVPSTIAVNAAGDVYFTCEDPTHPYMFVRKITAATGKISTIPCKVTSHAGPGGVAVDNAGNVYITSALQHKIFKYNETTKKTDTIAGVGTGNGTYYGKFSGDGGLAKMAELSYPNHICLDDSGNVYFSDLTNQRVRKITVATGIITTVAGSGVGAGTFPGGAFSGDGGPAINANLGGPGGLYVDHSDNIYITDTYHNRILKVDKSTGIITTIAGKTQGGFSGDGGPATSAQLYMPYDIAVDACGNIYISDFNNVRVRKITVTSGNANATTFIKPSLKSICTGSSISFSDSSNFSPSAWQWNFPGGSPLNSNSKNPVITYSSPGAYKVILTASNGCNNATDTLNSITVNEGFNMTSGANPATVCPGQTTTLTATGAVMYTWAAGSGLSTTTGSSVNVNPTTSTTYTVTGDSAGCTVRQQVIVTTAAGDTAGIISSPHDTICNGSIGRMNLSSNSSNVIQWQSSETTQNFTNTGTTNTVTYITGPLSQSTNYRVVVGSGTCADTSKTFTLTVAPSPVATFIPNDTGKQVTFTSSAADVTTYYWNFGDSTSSADANPVHVYDSTGTYHVCLTVSNHSKCNYTLCQNINVKTGINEISNESDFKIYPSPFSNEIVIEKPGANTIRQVEIFDVPGRMILHTNFNSNLTKPLRIDMTGTREGIYFLRIKTNEGDYIKKIIKQN